MLNGSIMPLDLPYKVIVILYNIFYANVLFNMFESIDIFNMPYVFYEVPDC